MKHIHYLYIGALAFLIACSSEERITTTNGNEKTSDAIELSAGIAVGNSKATTRTGAEDNHANHKTFTSGTKIALRISGTWTGHGTGTVIQTTTATVGDATGADNRHNALTCNPVRYWEDYGTSDINNTAGRTEGLTIYGAAVNNKSLSAASINELITTDALWNAIPWVLDADQTASNKTPTDKDLLISNNATGGDNTPYEGRYRFDNRYDGKLLEFKHALSKITVNLMPGAGFTSGFTGTPVVKLTSKDGTAETASALEWARITGKVDVSNGSIDFTGDGQGTRSAITMCDATLSSTAQTAGYTVAKEALVMPGSEFTSDNAIIARIDAAGNIYYVTAQKIRTAINSSTHGTDGSYLTQAGKNYIINVKVNQTDISVEVTATIANWTDVSATQVAPVINLVGNLGDVASDWGADKAFSFYRSSTSLNSGYSSGVSKENGYYPKESVLNYTYSSTSWSMTPSLYWPDHNTHYQFRCVWPQTVTTSGDGVLTSPRVEDGTGTTSGYQVIKVKNVAYSAGSFPSDLMIARPNVANVAGNCGSKESDAVHPKKNLFTEGICARTGSIDLTFKYMMSQVEVNLTTTDTDYDKVKLDGAIVELVNVHKTGSVKLGSMEVVTTGVKSATPVPATDTFGDYTLDYNYTSKHYHSAIVPQLLTFSTPLADGNLKFRIKIKNAAGDAVDDIYYADIQPIAVKVTGSSDAAAPVTNWESGYHYVYTLHLSKTEIKVTATLANWTEVTASQTVWF